MGSGAQELSLVVQYLALRGLVDDGAQFENLIKEVIGTLGSELVGLHLKGILTGKWLTMPKLASPGRDSRPGSARPLMSKHQNTEKKKHG